MTPKPIAIILGSVCIVTLLVLAKFVWRMRPEKLRSPDEKKLIDVMGVVIDIDKSPEMGIFQNTSYSPVVEFKTEDGQWLVSNSRVYTSEKPEIGQEILMKYNPDDPNKSMIVVDQDWRFRFLIAVGALIMLGSLLSLWILFD